jgi:4-hydroxy 2-oxovalerate aldolase
MKNRFKLLDCTIRDGGYYTNWDFDHDLIVEYAKSMEELPIDYIEVGYRSIPLEGYLGKYFYCPIYVLEELKNLMPSKKLVIILNEKDIRAEHVEKLLLPIKPYVTLIRIAVDPKNFERAIQLAKAIKKLGFELAFNVMYMSNWKKDPTFLNLLEDLDNTLDYFYMVDSFGGILPNEVKEIIKLVKTKTNVPLGFHGHDNLNMALINTITALEEGCDIVDSTITGMGRGAGNLKTELLLTYLDSQKQIELNFNLLSGVVANFEKLKKDYDWGTSLPYMFSGAHSLPQKEVMEWVGMNRYSLSSILNALNNQKLIQKDNIKLPQIKKGKTYSSAILIGGGKSSIVHKIAVEKFLASHPNIALIHVGARYIKSFSGVNNDQYFSLVGVENEDSLLDISTCGSFKNCVYGPFPRKMGTSIPIDLHELSFELEAINFTKASNDSPFAIACQLSLDLGINKIHLLGFDGYDTSLNQNQFLLAQENQKIIDDLNKLEDMHLYSVSPTRYKNIKLISLYSLLK